MFESAKFVIVSKGRFEVTENGKLVRFLEKNGAIKKETVIKVSKITSVDRNEDTGLISITTNNEYIVEFSDFPRKAYDVLCGLMASVD